MHGEFQPANRAELKTGVDAWMNDPAKARVDYGGEIGDWDVSWVTSIEKMLWSRLFLWVWRSVCGLPGV